MAKPIKTAAGILLIFLTAHGDRAAAQRWDGWHGFGWGGGGFQGAILPGVGWAGGWGGRGGSGRPAGWGQPWGWSYYRIRPRPTPGYGVGVGWGDGWPTAADAGYGACSQRRWVSANGRRRRQVSNVCSGSGGDGGWGW